MHMFGVQHGEGAVMLSYNSTYTREGENDGVEEARRWGAVMIFGDANLKSLFA